MEAADNEFCIDIRTMRGNAWTRGLKVIVMLPNQHTVNDFQEK